MRSPLAWTAVLLACLLTVATASIGPNKQACSNKGIFTPDLERCQCFQCYSGDKCETFNTNCTLTLTTAEGLIFSQYFEMEAQQEESWHVTLPPWYRMHYQDPVVIPPLNTPFNQMVRNTIFGLHEAVGNADTTGKILFVGDGSMQVIRGLLYAISEKEKRPFWVYARPPFYPIFRYWATENPAVTYGLTNRTDLDPREVIEIVTWPNNPSGDQFPPVYAKAAYTIYDMVYYWPHTCPQLEKKNESIMVFSSSKLTGHAASRVGWALLDDPLLADYAIGFVQVQTYNIAIEPLWRQMKILQNLQAQVVRERDVALSTGKAPSFFAYSKQSLPSYRLASVEGTWFAWVQCLNWTPSSTLSCADMFKPYGMEGEFGNGETGVPGYVRFNLNCRDETFALFLLRLQQMFNAPQ